MEVGDWEWLIVMKQIIWTSPGAVIPRILWWATLLQAGANSFLPCPLVERTGKSENVSFHIARAILEGESLTTALKVEGKVPAAKRPCPEADLRTVELGSDTWIY